MKALISLFYSSVLLGFCLLVGMVVMDSTGGMLGSVIAYTIYAMGIVAAIWLFRESMNRGFYKLFLESRATHDLDHAMHQNDPNVTLGSVEEWFEKLNSETSKFSGGHVIIWGLDRKYNLDDFNSLSSFKLNNAGKLILNFENGNRLHVEGTHRLYYSDSFIKLLDASKIKWMWNHGKNNIEITYDGKKLSSRGNADREPKNYDFNLSTPPITIWRNV